jgi:ABC-type nitrate/sulfonate/bicarbonate transport system permease component
MSSAATSRRGVSSLAGLIVFLGVWEAAVQAGLLPRTLVPPPSAVPRALLAELRNGFWLASVLSSLGHYVVGVLIGSLGGVGFGVATALSARLDALTSGIARLLRPIPPLAWIPFALIWFGASEGAAAFIIAIGVFWVNYFAAIAAVRAIDPGLFEVADAFGQGGLLPRLVKIVLPGASPGILAGLRSGLGQGWMAVVAAELFGVAGVGQRMSDAAGLLATDVLIVYMLTIALLYALSDAALQWVTRRLLAWSP